MRSFSILWMVACLSVMTWATVTVDDHFSDAAIGTNTDGIGTGFNGNGIWGGTVTESETTVTLASPTAGWERANIASKEAVAISTPARYEFLGVKFAKNTSSWGTGTTDRLYLGVRASNSTGDGSLGDGQSNPDTGFWIQMESDSVPAGAGDGSSWTGTSCLFYESASNVRTVLASWTFDTLNWDDNNAGTMNFTPVLDITLQLSATGYSLTIAGDTISNVTGSLTGTYAAAGITNELTTGYAAAFVQGEAPSVNTSIDRIIVTENAVPSKIDIDQPETGEVHVPVDQILSWLVVDSDVTLIDFYLGTDPNLTVSARKLFNVPATTTSYTPSPALANTTTYYWRVDAYEPNQAPGATDLIMTKGDVWHFTTAGLAAEVSPVSPAITAVNAGEPSIVLSVTGYNATAYQWYKQDVGVLSNGSEYSGVTTNTLTIYDVQLADEGNYYCQVDNDSPGTEPVDSVPGLVMTKRVIIHYPLDTVVDGVTPDVVGGDDMTLVNNVIGNPLPSLVTGVPELGGSGLLFNNTDSSDPNYSGQYATAGDVDVEVMGTGLTVEAWIKWAGTNGVYQGVVTRKTTWAGNQMMWQLEQDMNTAGVSFTRSGSSSTDRAPLTVDQWAYIVATYDSATGTIRIYKDGELYATATGFTYGTGTDAPLKLGCNDLVEGVASGFFNGTLDDVKIYNYARSSSEIAQSYADIMNVSVCNREGTAAMEFDVNDDCKVDLLDFAEFAADWLNDNRVYPQP
ncbi:MAG: immunoglobulin domain-containing protein [Planctomycetaceae bacterium]|nr:immunoglobulin domain-containing protein [Planctomycetaceae bacterium]